MCLCVKFTRSNTAQADFQTPSRYTAAQAQARWRAGGRLSTPDLPGRRAASLPAPPRFTRPPAPAPAQLTNRSLRGTPVPAAPRTPSSGPAPERGTQRGRPGAVSAGTHRAGPGRAGPGGAAQAPRSGSGGRSPPTGETSPLALTPGALPPPGHPPAAALRSCHATACPRPEKSRGTAPLHLKSRGTRSAPGRGGAGEGRPRTRVAGLHGRPLRMRGSGVWGDA